MLRALSRTRDAEEFRGRPVVTAPRRAISAYSWSIEAIRNARDAQMRGDFQIPVRLAEALRTDDALFAAYHNRIAPHNAVATRLAPCEGTRGAAVARRAAASCIAPRPVLEGIIGTRANHGIAIGYVEHATNDDGTRVDMRLTEWPLEHVRWNASTETLETRTLEGPLAPIVHGDGHWIVFRKFTVLPWTQDACILPAALLWAAHANGVKDWANASTSHGLAKVMGELPEGWALRGADGELTNEASFFLTMLENVVSGASQAGIQPSGSKVNFVANASTAWQVFSELINSREKAAARIYTGTDAMLGSVGGAPGVDIATLFGVATTIVQGDFECVESALSTGLYEPWTAINYGDSSYAPSLEYLLPDPDAAAKSRESSEKHARLLDTIKRMREEQMRVDQDVVNALARVFGVDPVPQLADAEARAVPLDLAPTDVARVVRVNEARASRALPPLADDRGALFISELEERAKAERDAAAAKADAAAQIAVDKVTLAREPRANITIDDVLLDPNLPADVRAWLEQARDPQWAKDHNPPGFVTSEACWERAKRAAQAAGASDMYAFATWWYQKNC